MIKLQVNIGDDYNQQWSDVDSTDMLVFSNGYLSIDSGFSGVKRIVNEFREVDTPYAKCCHLITAGEVHQVNYNAEKLYTAASLFLAHPDQSNVMNRFSFRLVFIDYLIDWIKIPQIYVRIPKFFYGHSNIDTIITPFFYTDESGISSTDVLEIDSYRFLATKVEQLSNYWKVWVQAYDNIEESISVSKEKYIIRDYNLHSVDDTLSNMTKVLFHDDMISLAMIPSVDMSSDITDTTERNFRTTYEWANIDMSNYPFQIELDSTLDLTNLMMISDFTLTHSIDTGDNVIYGETSINTDIKKGDFLLIKNDVWSEIFQITDMNLGVGSQNVSRPFRKYEFLSSDPSIKVYLNRKILFQPILLNSGDNLVNYPMLFNMEVKYLNIG